MTPVMHFRRTATRDTELRGRRIAAGDKVVVFYSSANRDEDVFAEPDRFDITRTPNEHVAFGGGGAHFCLGANLARLEIRALFEQVLARLARPRARRPGRAPALELHQRPAADAGPLHAVARVTVSPTNGLHQRGDLYPRIIETGARPDVTEMIRCECGGRRTVQRARAPQSLGKADDATPHFVADV